MIKIIIKIADNPDKMQVESFLWSGLMRTDLIAGPIN
jgi:hypothetical protein